VEDAALVVVDVVHQEVEDVAVDVVEEPLVERLYLSNHIVMKVSLSSRAKMTLLQH
jgi:hypothetical protein